MFILHGKTVARRSKHTTHGVACYACFALFLATPCVATLCVAHSYGMRSGKVWQKQEWASEKVARLHSKYCQNPSKMQIEKNGENKDQDVTDVFHRLS